MIPKLKLFLSVYAVFIFQSVLHSEEIAAETLRFKTLNAVRTETAPMIDGKIDDEVWTKAKPVDDFLQFEPYNFCLLYTSPSPRDQRGSRMPSSA